MEQTRSLFPEDPPISVKAPRRVRHAEAPVHVICGDSLEIMATLEANSVDAVVTDPPYGIRFMGKAWDGDDIKRLARVKGSRVLRPNGTRGYRSLASAAGQYDPSKNGAFQVWCEAWGREALRVLKPGGYLLAFGSSRMSHRLVCGLEDSGFEIRDTLVWLHGQGFPKSLNLKGDRDGWGTALKPAHEPIVMVRKPFGGTVAANLEQHGTGAININGCRIMGAKAGGRNSRPFHDNATSRASDATNGRWPANVIFDPDAAVMLDEQSGSVGASAPVRGTESSPASRGSITGTRARVPGAFHGDAGGASRFFYCAKPSPRERGEFNVHPTVKPIRLLRWLVRLVTPPGGLVLDPFGGSGTTGLAAREEGLRSLLIERNPGYCEIISQRLALHARAST